VSIKDMKLPRVACVRAQIILPLEVRRRPDAGAVPPGRCHVEHGTDGLLVLPAMPTVVVSSTAFHVPASFSGLTSTTRPIATIGLPTSHLPLEDGRSAIIICCRPTRIFGSPNLTGAPPIPPSFPAQPEPAGVRLRRLGRHLPPGYFRWPSAPSFLLRLPGVRVVAMRTRRA
jgi:hypothetical protein